MIKLRLELSRPILGEHVVDLRSRMGSEFEGQGWANCRGHDWPGRVPKELRNATNGGYDVPSTA